MIREGSGEVTPDLGLKEEGLIWLGSLVFQAKDTECAKALSHMTAPCTWRI